MLLFAIAASAMFAGSETGFYSMNRLRLRHDARQSRSAAMLERVVRSPSAFLATLLIGNNLANDAAVKAAGQLCAQFGLERPEFWGALLLTPIIFLFGEVLPKQVILASPRRMFSMAGPLALCRIVFWPVTAPLAAFARRLEGEEGSSLLARSQFEALLEEGEQQAPGEARVMTAALRALDSKGKGLRPFLRTDLPTLKPTDTVDAARTVLSNSAETLALVPMDGENKAPGLLLGSHLALASSEASLTSLALPLSSLPDDLDFAGGLTRLRALGVAFAWVEKPGEWAGLWDLEYALASLLAPTPSSANPAS
ncbi:MAG: CNNM domain-containing protein [Planctomycetota bacterium]